MVVFALPFAAGNALYIALNALPRYFLADVLGLAAVAVFSATITLAICCFRSPAPCRAPQPIPRPRGRRAPKEQA